jgi:hypothetical protein
MQEAIIYKGIAFKKKATGYYECTQQRKSNPNRQTFLHRYVWVEEVGSIPDKFHVHHKDGNRANNELSNLECVDATTHVKLHADIFGKTDHVCVVCGKTFTAAPQYIKKGFCGMSCQNKARRLSGIDDETRVCTECGYSFLVNKYKKTRLCSRKCQDGLQSRTEKERQKDRPVFSHICKWCGAGYLSKKEKVLKGFCSIKCTNAEGRHRRSLKL